MEIRLTAGSVPRSVLRFSVPFLLSALLQSLYGMADLYVIGRFGDPSGTTAVSVGSQVMHVLTVLVMGLAMGTTVTTARAAGARSAEQKRAEPTTDPAVDGVNRAVGNSALLFGGISLCLTAVMLCLTRPVVALMSTPEAAVPSCAAYLTVCFAGIPFITAYNLIAAVYRAAGDSVTPLRFVGTACVCNVALDFLLTGALSMGTAGVALGTVLSQAVSVGYALIHTARRGLFRLTREDLTPDRRLIREILRIGTPVMVQDGLIQVTFIVITVIANRRRLDDAAAVGIVEKLIGIFFMVPSAMLATVSALCSMCLGAGKEERSRRTLRFCILAALVWGVSVSVLMQFTAERFVGLFTDSASVARLGGSYLRGYVWDCALAGVHFCFSGYFSAVGRSELSFIHNLLSMLFVRIPGAYFGSLLFPDSLFPMGLASTGGSLLSVAVCLLFDRRLRRKEGRTG